METSPEPNPDDEALKQAKQRNRLLYEAIDRRASVFGESSPIRRAINEAVARARPEEVAELPDDENEV